jgi:hypothetical protein
VSALEIHYAEEWAALYVDGKLDEVGDTYVTEERALELAGVTCVHDDAFMRGQTHREGVAQTLSDVTDYRERRATARERAELLRQRAADLLRQAELAEAGGAS